MSHCIVIFLIKVKKNCYHWPIALITDSDGLASVFLIDFFIIYWIWCHLVLSLIRQFYSCNIPQRQIKDLKNEITWSEIKLLDRYDWTKLDKIFFILNFKQKIKIILIYLTLLLSHFVILRMSNLKEIFFSTFCLFI